MIGLRTAEQASLHAITLLVAAQSSAALAQSSVEQQISASAQPQAPGTAKPDSDAKQMPVGVGETIFVTGSRIPRPNMTSDSPIETLRAQDFALTGVPNVEQTLNQLPQLVPGFTNTSNFANGTATLDLRGLGSVRTLILVNGRRWIPSNADGAPSVDVNSIPAALVERVDVVTGGASAVYGSDAVTGVINFILKNRVDGLHVAAAQNITARGDGAVSNIDLTYGGRFWGDRGKLILSGGFLQQRPLRQSSRRFARVDLQEACVLPGTRGPDAISTAAGEDDCGFPNLWGFVQGGSPVTPGTNIPVRAFFPTGDGITLIRNRPGLRFGPSGEALPFDPVADLYNEAPYRYMQVGLKRWSISALPTIEISPTTTAYSEMSLIRTQSPQQLAPVAAVLGAGSPTVPVALVNLDNPFLTADAARVLDVSYGVDANGNRGFVGSAATGFSINPAYTGDADGLIVLPALFTRLDALGPLQTSNLRVARRMLAGVRGELSKKWHYDVYFSAANSRNERTFINSGSATRLQQAILAQTDPVTGQVSCLDPTNGCVPANIFGPGNLSEEAAEFIRTTSTNRTTVTEQVGEATVRGDVPLTGTTNAAILFGTNWRRTSYSFVPDEGLRAGDDLAFVAGPPTSGATRVWELFTEARVPLLAGAPFAQELSTEIGARYSRYRSIGGVWTWKALADWSPVTGVRFRGGFQRAVRAPNVRELYAGAIVNTAFFLDPCAAEAGLLEQRAVAAACVRNGVPADASQFLFFEDFAAGGFRGNPAVKPEVARTFTLGATLTPNGIPGLRFSLDYYSLRIRNVISPLGGGSTWLVMGCILAGADPADPLCEAYQRDPATGHVFFIDQPTANSPYVTAKGVDWQFSYHRPVRRGIFGSDEWADLSLAGTVYLHAGLQPNLGLPELSCAGQLTSACSVTVGYGAFPRWKVLNQLIYGFGNVSLNLRHRWFSPTHDNRLGLARQLGISYYHVPAQGAVLESRHYFDFAVTLKVSKRFDLMVGVNNLTDRQPPITGLLSVAMNTDPSLYDVLGRRFFTALNARF